MSRKRWAHVPHMSIMDEGSCQLNETTLKDKEISKKKKLCEIKIFELRIVGSEWLKWFIFQSVSAMELI